MAQASRPAAPRAATPFSFAGYRRADGRIGVRNHLLVLSTLALTNRLAELAADGMPDTLLVATDFQRGLRTRDAQMQERVIRGLLSHPNTGGAVVFVHDSPARLRLATWAATLGKPLQVIAFMEGSGMASSIARGARAIAQVRSEMAGAPDTVGGLGDLTLALECGGSDPTSAVCANPAIGGFVDRVVAAGGRAIVSETAEFIGAEPVVLARATTPEIAQQVVQAISRCEQMMEADGEDYRGVNPTAENIAGGLTTLIEKSMGAVAKCGSSPIAGCLDFAEAPGGPGLYFMDTPFFSPVSITGMVCAGAQLTLFAIGVFNPSGNPLAPTVKVCGNPQTLRDWPDVVDVDVSMLVAGKGQLPQAVENLATRVQAICNGEQSWTERWREGQVLGIRSLPAL
ncbi:MAG: putative hydro-lyase [Paucimonas sp.]|nr:putative hydro-lyase [Paucimonas sp.]